MTGAVTASRPDRRPVRSRSTGWSCCAESVPQGARHLSATSSERARRAGEADKQQRTEAPGAARPSPLHQARKAFQSAAYGLRRPSAAPPAAPSMSRPGVLASMPQARTARPIVTRSAGCSGNSNRPPGSETAFQRFMTRYTDTVVGVLWRLASRASAPAGAAAWSAWPRRAPHGTGGNCHGKIAGSVCDFGCRSSVRGCLQIWGFGDKSWTRIRSILVRGCPQIWGFGDDVSYAVSCNAVWDASKLGVRRLEPDQPACLPDEPSAGTILARRPRDVRRPDDVTARQTDHVRCWLPSCEVAMPITTLPRVIAPLSSFPVHERRRDI